MVMLCLLTGCFHESPDPLAPGGMVDPTKVNVEVNVSLDFTIDPFVTQSRAGSDFIVVSLSTFTVKTIY